MRTFPCLAQGARDPADRARQGPRAVLADHAFVIPFILEAADDTVVRAEPTLRREE
ncbi:hypothetical protein ACLQ2P_33995 [Actinomadura citrea]|uniref:hypothetical protein n=1 Tax=Actinomadura citrea TaxID=46158 RepID=UPI003CE45152